MEEIGFKRVAAAIGGGFGVVAIVVLKFFNVASPVLKWILLPSRFFTSGYQGENVWTTGAMVAVIDFVGNVAIYAAIGYLVGWFIEAAPGAKRKG